MGDIGFLGTGAMGYQMVLRLLAAGHQVTVWNRTREKAVPLAAIGATVAATPAETVAGKDIVFTNLTDGPALKSVILGTAGVLQAIPLPRMVVDLATVSPSESAEIAAAVGVHGLGFLSAPVSGTVQVAAAGKLTIMASGDRAVYDVAGPYLDVLCQIRYYVGPGEHARYLKLIHQMLLAATMQVWAEGLVMGEKAGLDWNIMLEVLRNSAVGSPMVTRKAQSLAARSYDKPHLSMHNMAKDLDLALDAAEDLEVELPTTRQIREVYRAAMADGLEWKDYSAVVLELEKVAGLRPEEG